MLKDYLIDPEDDEEELDEEADSAREALRDYYGTAMVNGFPMAVIDLADVDSMSDEEAIEEAIENGLL